MRKIETSFLASGYCGHLVFVAAQGLKVFSVLATTDSLASQGKG